MLFRSYREQKYDKTLIKRLKDYVLSSDETHKVREFVEIAFKAAGIDAVWHGHCQNEEYSVTQEFASRKNPVSSVLVKINPEFYRPAEVDLLIGDSTPAREELGWQPKVSFRGLVTKMVENDLKS